MKPAVNSSHAASTVDKSRADPQGLSTRRSYITSPGFSTQRIQAPTIKHSERSLAKEHKPLPARLVLGE